jgi:ZIP family zinc transporter
MDGSIGLALLLSTLAGLSTAVGSLLSLFIHRPGSRFMSFTLGLSGGVMLEVSFLELLPEGIQAIGFVPANLAFFGGMAIMFLVDVLIPHDYAGEHHRAKYGTHNGHLLRTGLFVALGVTIHNFPEGIASLASTLEDTRLGIAVAAAIALHNIPEGLAVSAPVYAATQSHGKAFVWSILSGVAEPVGAGLAALILTPILTELLLGYVVASVAGIMVFIALDELVPVACSFGEEHMPIVGAGVGMIVMALSLWMLQ